MPVSGLCLLLLSSSFNPECGLSERSLMPRQVGTEKRKRRHPQGRALKPSTLLFFLEIGNQSGKWAVKIVGHMLWQDCQPKHTPIFYIQSSSEFVACLF